jgi:hypothetical protein
VVPLNTPKTEVNGNSVVNKKYNLLGIFLTSDFFDIVKVGQIALFHSKQTVSYCFSDNIWQLIKCGISAGVEVNTTCDLYNMQSSQATDSVKIQVLIEKWLFRDML